MSEEMSEDSTVDESTERESDAGELATVSTPSEDAKDVEFDSSVASKSGTVGSEVNVGQLGSKPDADAGTTGSGGGTVSPHETAIGTQPVPVGAAEGGAPPASSFTAPAFSHLVPPTKVETRNEDFSAEPEADPKATHQGQRGSGVAPGASLPGESIAERNARRAARMQASEFKRAVEEGNLGNRAGRLEIGDEGGFDIIIAGGSEESQVRLSDLLRGRNGQLVRLGDIGLLRAGE